ncbi:MAG: MFS transporter, partial [Pseudomonadales bacterium]|nr:MFS transporter [Pseudomonadales bacterium]
AETIISVTFNSFNFFFYTNILGVPGTLAGLAITIALFFDAISDPLVGAWSDRFRSRFGRRHMFMFSAPLPVMLALFFIYAPPAGLGDIGLFVWLTTLTVFMRSCMTLYHVPHLALGAELSSDFTERTRVMSINTLWGALGAIVILVIGYSVFFAKTPEFENGMLNPAGYPRFAVFSALVGGAIMLYSTISTMKLIPRLSVNAPGQESISVKNFLGDCLDAFNNHNYRMLLIGYLLLSATLGIRDTIGLHMNTYFWELVPEQIRFIPLFVGIAPFIGFFATAPLHERFEKKPVIIGTLIALLIFAAAPVLLRLVGLFPENHSKLLLPTLIVFVVITLSFGSILLISVMSVLADIADDHELTTGRRQEGMFYAARSFFAKASSGLGHLLGGIAIDVIHFPVGAEPGTVPADTVLHLGLVDGPIAAVPGAIAIIFYLKYTLSRARHKEIQMELARRRLARAEEV